MEAILPKNSDIFILETLCNATEFYFTHWMSHIKIMVHNDGK
jgi:hypothetical protein